MNYLGHAYLSFNHTQLLVGNMISDFVKGRAVFRLNGNIQGGIRLHRAIDQFTDSHEAIKEAKKFFQPAYRLYSAPIVDVVMDHYLANDPLIFNGDTLKKFTESTYAAIESQASELPASFIQVFFWMKKNNWLYHYQYKEGIRSSLAGLNRRASYMKESDTAYHIFQENYKGLEDCYQKFIGDVKQFAKDEISRLIH